MSGVTEQFYWMGDEKVSFCQATFFVDFFFVAKNLISQTISQNHTTSITYH